jgi:hypothetical protein
VESTSRQPGPGERKVARIFRTQFIGNGIACVCAAFNSGLYAGQSRFGMATMYAALSIVFLVCLWLAYRTNTLLTKSALLAERGPSGAA